MLNYRIIYTPSYTGYPYWELQCSDKNDNVWKFVRSFPGQYGDYEAQKYFYKNIFKSYDETNLITHILYM